MTNVASLRQIRRRIRSVENTKKITRAMEMVAAAKLRRFQDLLESSRPYTEKMEELLAEFLERLPSSYQHPFLGNVGAWSPRPEGGGTPPLQSKLLVLFTSDTGLCGTYNSAVEEKVKGWLRKNAGRKQFFIFVGKHGAGMFQKKVSGIRATLTDLRVSRVEEILGGLAKNLSQIFREGEVGEIEILYTHMENLTRYEPVTKRLLPFPVKGISEKESETLVEPDVETVLNRLIPAVFEARLRYIFYHALLTEQIARMTAMRQATKNAKDMIDELTLLRNKARQASITKELIEIVSGSRAQKLK